jgi:hypothetical protein
MDDITFSSLDLNLLRVFDALFQERSLPRAADQLELTPSAVSHALSRLRRLLDDELFVRTPDGMRPTRRAEEIGPRLHKALAHLAAVLATVPHNGAEGTPRIGGLPAPANALAMLQRAAAAMRVNKDQALGKFSRGENGFRSLDLYVFCLGLDGRIDAHPDPALIGVDARMLTDRTGKRFAQEMLERAQEGTATEVHYLWPRPGASEPEPKIAYVTRIKDQVCGVGYYPESAPAAAEATTAAR